MTLSLRAVPSAVPLFCFKIFFKPSFERPDSINLPNLSRAGINVVSLSTSKSAPDLATISVGGMIRLPADSSKNSCTSINSIELSPCTGILTAVRVTAFLLVPSLSHSSSLIASFNLALVPIFVPL